MSDSDLDRRLGDLFAERSLAVPPRIDATGLVLGRVRRARRRRRAIRITAPVLAAVLLGGAAVNSLGPHRPTAPASPASPASPAQQTSGPVTPGVQELVMYGTAVGPVRLGMSRAEAEATGLLVTPGADVGSGCRSFPGRRGLQSVLIGPSGVTEISVYTFIATPEGAATGDTYARLQATYPDAMPAAPDARADYRVPVPGRSDAWYVFSFESPDGQNGIGRQTRVSALTLASDDRGCG